MLPVLAGRQGIGSPSAPGPALTVAGENARTGPNIFEVLGIPGAETLQGSSTALRAAEENVVLSVMNLVMSRDPKDIIRGLRMLPAFYERSKANPKAKQRHEEALLEVFFSNGKEVREEVVKALENIGAPEEFTSHLIRFVGGNETLKAASLDKLFGYVGSYQGDMAILLKIVEELITEEVRKGETREVVEKALELLCQVKPEEIKDIHNILEERFNRTPSAYDALIENVYRFMANFKRDQVIAVLEEAIQVRGRDDFKVIAVRVLLDLYTDETKKNSLLKFVAEICVGQHVSPAVKDSLRKVIISCKQAAFAELIALYPNASESARTVLLGMIDQIACQEKLGEKALAPAADILKMERDNRGLAGVRLAMETRMIHLTDFSGPVRAAAYQQALDILYDIWHNRAAIENLVEHGAGFLSRIIKKAAEEKGDLQKHKFFVHMAAMILARFKEYLGFFATLASHALRMSLILNFLKREADAINDVALVISSPALAKEELERVLNGRVSQDQVVKIFGTTDQGWRQFFIDPDLPQMQFKPEIITDLEKAAGSKLQHRQLLAIYRYTMFKYEEAIPSADERKVLVAACKNINITPTLKNKLLKMINLFAKHAFETKEESGDLQQQMARILAGEEGIDFQPSLSGKASFNADAESTDDAWEVFSEAVQAYVNLALNLSVEKRHETINILFDYYSKFKTDQSLRGIYIIESAFVQLLISGQIFALADKERILTLLENRFVGEKSINLGSDQVSELWRQLSRDVSSWAKMGVRLNALLSRLLSRYAGIKFSEKPAVNEFLSRILEAFGSAGSIQKDLIMEEVERIIQSILPA